MGWYINQNSKGEAAPAKGKTDFLVSDGAEVISKPKGPDENLVVVVDNGPFEAAARVHNQKEYDEFTQVEDSRPKTWLLYDKAEEVAR